MLNNIQNILNTFVKLKICGHRLKIKSWYTMKMMKTRKIMRKKNVEEKNVILFKTDSCCALITN